jgi:hypothetical protein
MVDSTSAQNNATDVDIQALLRRAEMIDIQLQMEARFNRNMAAFKANMPKVHEMFTDYEPEELRLEYSKEGYLHLINYQLGNKPVYAENPTAFVQRQYDLFCASPSTTTMNFEKSKIHNQEFIHQPIINEWLDAFEPLNGTQKIGTDVPIGFMLVTGVGLGYHIEKISKELDVKYLCIFDPHLDSMYASLHTIEWTPILEKYCSTERKLFMYLDISPEVAVTDLRLLREKVGVHNFMTTFIYQHFTSTQAQAFIDLYYKKFQLQGLSLGFFDDERNSFAHTIHNINAGFAFFKHGTDIENLPPVLLVGNGPSLDEHIEFIREHQADSIIITCGTALSSLAKVGIRPDFHVEMERSSITPYFIKAGTSDEYRRGIPLLALNTAPPNMTELFDEVCLAIKPNDAGQFVINNTFSDHGLRSLALCNPTVTNAGLSFALSMGFTEILLVGVDLGQKTPDTHHSSLSIYHDLEERSKGKIQTGLKALKQSVTPGNFGGDVYTNWILNLSRNEMEVLLRLPNPAGRQAAVYNLNDGALIEGTIPARYGDLKDIKPVSDKAGIITAIKQRNFKHLGEVHLTADIIDKQYLQSFRALKKSLSLPKKIRSTKELHSAMNHIYGAIIDASFKTPLGSQLLRGSVGVSLGIMAGSLFFMRDKHMFNKHYDNARRRYMQLIKGAFKKMESNPTAPDNSMPPHVEEFRQL